MRLLACAFGCRTVLAREFASLNYFFELVFGHAGNLEDAPRQDAAKQSAPLGSVYVEPSANGGGRATSGVQG